MRDHDVLAVGRRAGRLDDEPVRGHPHRGSGSRVEVHAVVPFDLSGKRIVPLPEPGRQIAPNGPDGGGRSEEPAFLPHRPLERHALPVERSNPAGQIFQPVAHVVVSGRRSHRAPDTANRSGNRLGSGDHRQLAHLCFEGLDPAGHALRVLGVIPVQLPESVAFLDQRHRARSGTHQKPAIVPGQSESGQRREGGDPLNCRGDPDLARRVAPGSENDDSRRDPVRTGVRLARHSPAKETLEQAYVSPEHGVTDGF